MEPFVGQISLFGFNFAPAGWALCQGQLLPINQNTALFSLLGTTYGGDGVSNFALPDLRGRAPIAFGQGAGLSNHQQGEKGGAEQATLTAAQMPAHNHAVTVPTSDGGATIANPNGGILALTDANAYTTTGNASGTYGGATSAMTGGNQPVSVMQPYLVLNYCIALQGVYPSRP
ncbi:MAG: tail fiber protein [Chitinophagaceae bacterium]